MTYSSIDLSRRGLLGAAAAGAVVLGVGSRATAGPGAPGLQVLAGAARSTVAELEAKGLALEPPVFLLETMVPDQIRTLDSSRVRIVDGVGHFGGSSLRWDYQGSSRLQVRAPICYASAQDTFAVWLYQSTASSGKLRLEFGRGSGTDAWCDINLNFTGWRTAWVRLAYDLNGTPHKGMNTLRFVAPKTAGIVHIDQIILNTQVRSDYPTPDRQVPFVNPGVSDQPNSHWTDLLRYSTLAATPLATPAPTSAELADLASMKTAYNTRIRKQVKVTAALVDMLTASVDDLGVPADGAAGGGGRAVLGHQEAIYPAAIADEWERVAPSAPLRGYTDLMFSVASAYDSTDDPTLREPLSVLYLRMLNHLFDQGYVDGSCQGTIHHLGYQARGLYTSVWLMRGLLQNCGLLQQTRESMAWLQGLGRLRDSWADASAFGGLFDVLNTNLIGLLGTSLMMDDEATQAAWLKQLQGWLNHALTHSPGIESGFKPDLATFHHVSHYPDYSRDGFKGGSPVLAVLAMTSFAVARESHELWNQSLLRMRFYANKDQWPLGLAARHPTGDSKLSLDPYMDMVTAGRPDGQLDLDPQMGAAFLRLAPAQPSSKQKAVIQALTKAGVKAEPSPTGCASMNYAAAVLHRRDDWLVAARGHNRYLWSTEIYPTDNLYGRYAGYGQIQVMSGGNPVTNRDSGFEQPGWDWARWPGTTAIYLTSDELKADLSQDGTELLLTDSLIGGGGSIEGRNGAFLLNLHEHPKYDESHRARKSAFFFDNRVVALGAGIENNDGDHRTETILFQCFLPDPSAAQVDATLGTVTSLPYRADRELTQPLWMVDTQRVGYFVAAGQRLVLARSVQTGPEQGGEESGSEPYSTAWLDHGPAPKDAAYEYALVVGATPESMAAFASDMADPQTAPYRVLRHDTKAHVVWDRATQITGHAVFEPTQDLTGGVVRSVDAASMVLTRTDRAQLHLSVTDPDLHLYEGLDPQQYDAQGNFVGGVDPEGATWRRNPSNTSKVTVVLAGRWSGGTPHVKVTPGSDTTAVYTTCQHGLSREVLLSPA